MRQRVSRQAGDDALKHEQWCYRRGLPSEISCGSGYVIYLTASAQTRYLDATFFSRYEVDR
jgi:hypothetical protein